MLLSLLLVDLSFAFFFLCIFFHYCIGSRPVVVPSPVSVPCPPSIMQRSFRFFRIQHSTRIMNLVLLLLCAGFVHSGGLFVCGIIREGQQRAKATWNPEAQGFKVRTIRQLLQSHLSRPRTVHAEGGRRGGVCLHGRWRLATSEGVGSVNNKGSKRSARLDLSLCPERATTSVMRASALINGTVAPQGGVCSAAALRRAVSNPLMYLVRGCVGGRRGPAHVLDPTGKFRKNGNADAGFW